MPSSTNTQRTERFEDITNLSQSGGGFQRVGEEFQGDVRDALSAVQRQFSNARDFLLPEIRRTTEFTPDQEAAFQLARDFAGAQEGNIGPAAQLLGETVEGRGVNPFVARAAQFAGEDAENRALQRFALMRRSGSPAEAAAVARGVAQAQTPILVGAAENEANRRLAAADSINRLGTLSQNLLLGTGGLQQQRGDRLAEEQFQNALFPQSRDEAATQNFINQFATLFPAFTREQGNFSDVDTVGVRTGNTRQTERNRPGFLNNILGGLSLARGLKII